VTDLYQKINGSPLSRFRFFLNGIGFDLAILVR